MSRLQACRITGSDIWGDIIKHFYKAFPLFTAIYEPFLNQSPNFILRIDLTRPKQRKKLLSPFALVALERKKAQNFYHLAPHNLHRLINSYRGTATSFNAILVSRLEGQLHILLFRSSFIRPKNVFSFIRKGLVKVNGKLIPYSDFCALPGDFITVTVPDRSYLISLLTTRDIRFYDEHLLINFKLYSIYYLCPINFLNLFFYFPFDLARALTNRIQYA